MSRDDRPLQRIREEFESMPQWDKIKRHIEGKISGLTDDLLLEDDPIKSAKIKGTIMAYTHVCDQLINDVYPNTQEEE